MLNSLKTQIANVFWRPSLQATGHKAKRVGASEQNDEQILLATET